MSIRLSPAVESLVKALGKLPGYGPRSAQRAAFHLLQNRDESLDELAAAVERVRRGVGRCRLCNTFTEGDICPVCLDEERDPGLLCVVESTADQMALDASLAWPGYYFVLSGRLSPVNGIGPADIGMPLYYLIDALKKRWPQLRVTRLARGLPAGIEIEYTDLSTIANAVYARRDA